MREWAMCGKEAAGFLPKGVGRSRALYHESTFFPRTYCIKIQIYEDVGQDSGKFATIGRQCGLIFQHQFGLISVTRALCIWHTICFPTKYQHLAMLVLRFLFARDSHCAM